jgi:hypothetical protein
MMIDDGEMAVVVQKGAAVEQRGVPACDYLEVLCDRTDVETTRRLGGDMLISERHPPSPHLQLCQQFESRPIRR